MFNFVKANIVAVVLLVILVACNWSLLNSQMFFTHDFVHGARIAELSRALSDGHFPARWSSNFGYGYGMPLFEFYAPLPFYVGALFYLMGLPLVTAVKLLFFLPSLGTLLGSYWLGKKLYGRAGGLVMAAAITLAPYRAVNLFVRGAVSETWGIMAAVWVLYTTVLVIKGEKRGWLYFVVSVIALFLSHNLVTMIFLPFAATFTIVLFVYYHWPVRWQKLWHDWQKLALLLGGYILSLGVASFYLLPSFLEKDLTIVEQKTTGGYFDYHLHFLYIRQFFRSAWGYGGSEWGPNDKISFFLGFGEFLAIALAVGSAVYFFWKMRQKKKVIFLLMSFLVCVGSALFMTIGKSSFIWDAIPLFKYIQFPWRYYSVLIIFLGLAGALFTQFLPRKIYIPLSVLVIGVTLVVNTTYFRPERYLDHASDLYYADPVRIQTQMSGILPDYIPRTLSLPVTPFRGLLTCNAESVVCPNTNILINREQEKLVSVKLPEAQPVFLEIAYFPGWMIEVDGTQSAYSITKNGTISVQLPAGEHTLGARFGDTPIRSTADSISAVSLLIFVSLILAGFPVIQEKNKHARK